MWYSFGQRTWEKPRGALALLGLTASLTHCGSPSKSDQGPDTPGAGGSAGSTTTSPATNGPSNAANVDGPTSATTGNPSTSAGDDDTTTVGSASSNTGASAGTGSNATTGGAGGGASDISATTAGGSGGGSATSSSSGGDPAVRFVGRIDRSDAAGERFAWSGSGLVAAFEGSQVSVSLNDGENEFTIVLDGEVLPKLVAESGTHDYLLADSLEPGSHVLELYRRTEASFGVTQFLGLDFGADGRLLAPPAAPARLLEFIGDSITCGYGNEGADTSCGFSADTENHYLTYGALAARELDADVITVAWSGKGIIFNYGEDTVDPLPALYDRTLPQDAGSAYDFAQLPDAVVINLGTNDFSTDGDPSPEDFEAEYLEFLQHIRTKYPDAFLLCTVGPLLSGDDLTAARAGIGAAVTALQNQGDLRVKSWEMNVANENPGCDWHPSLPTHEAMAAAVASELRTNLGW